jgi:hypothetical protein
MGRIKKKDIQVLHSYDTREKDPVSFCPFCLEHGLYEMLGPRILKPNEPVPEDYDQWRSCIGCGRTIPIYEQKFESEIEDVVESVDNPYDIGQNILGNENKKKSKRKSDMQRLKERIELEKDDDIRRELIMGKNVNLLYDSIR